MSHCKLQDVVVLNVLCHNTTFIETFHSSIAIIVQLHNNCSMSFRHNYFDEFRTFQDKYGLESIQVLLQQFLHLHNHQLMHYMPVYILTDL
jgi:hypothetical protein